jgi:hypothetical protein
MTGNGLGAPAASRGGHLPLPPQDPHRLQDKHSQAHRGKTTFYYVVICTCLADIERSLSRIFVL